MVTDVFSNYIGDMFSNFNGDVISSLGGQEGRMLLTKIPLYLFVSFSFLRDLRAVMTFERRRINFCYSFDFQACVAL